MRTWFYNEKPLIEAEQEFIKRKEDIITLRLGREWAGFDGLIESMLRKLDCRLIRVRPFSLLSKDFMLNTEFAESLLHTRATREDQQQVRLLLLHIAD